MTAWPATRPNRAIRTIFALGHCPKASEIGALEVLPSAFIFWKRGDSVSESRIQTDTPSSAIDIRNGTRQPHAANSVSPIAIRAARITISERKKPNVAVVWIHEVYRPRFPGGECSAT